VVRQAERIFIRRRGKVIAALIPCEQVAALERLEDEHGAKMVRKALKTGGAIPYEEVRRELGLP
jgi:antitoxin (DNA-binding transcriptional repressor) of toxin-antitoxin stability system